jgi:4-amino-4-deoxy-L-arabinose transferase-like glycosyltransferase
VARWLLILILAAYVLLGVAYSLGTPPWEAPDEPSHYLYAEYVATYGSLPPEAPPQRGNYWEDGYVTSIYEWFQPPLYYALVAPQIAFTNLLRPGTIPQAFPPVDPDFPGDVDNLFASPPDGSLGALFASPGLCIARLFSVALGLGTLLVAYRVAMLASGGDQSVALTATGVMAFIPQFTFISGYVTNDNLVMLMSALCLLAFLNLLKPSNGRSMWRVAGTGLLLALALYTKLSLLFVLPLGLLCLLLRLVRHRSVRQWLLESSVLVGAAILPFLFGLLVLPAMRDQVAYAYTSLQAKPQFMSLQYLAGLWPQTYTSFWGRFGWMNVATPRWIADTMNVVTLVGLIGSLVLLVRRKQQTQIPSVRQSLVLLWATCGLVALGFILYNLSVRQPQGRTLFAALPALVILVALGYRLLAGRLYVAVGASIVLLTFVANLVCLFGALLPAYALPI